MADISTTPSAYTDEPVRYGPLTVVDIGREAGAVTQAWRNQVLLQVNQHCLRLGVLSGQYPWHAHPKSDELFLVVEGSLVIELGDGTVVTLGPRQAVTVPAGVVHRTRGQGRTVTLCVEVVAAETVFVPDPGGVSDGVR
ncbi:MAG TPA: cupin domain-containing protein [Gemmatimonadales bacterium]|nr:cupin domain-containing protein [Gemmatimonadales bacterium]